MKTITWRLMATLTTVLLVFVFTRSFFVSFSLGFLEFLLKTPVYYLHERIWNMLPYGLINAKDRDERRSFTREKTS